MALKIQPKCPRVVEVLARVISRVIRRPAGSLLQCTRIAPCTRTYTDPHLPCVDIEHRGFHHTPHMATHRGASRCFVLGIGVHTCLSTFEKWATLLQPQGVHDLGIANHRLSCTSMSQLTESLLKYGWSGKSCFANNPWRKGRVFRGGGGKGRQVLCIASS